jgi:hypothetical protein
MNLICQSCGEEIEEKKYACPFDNIDNVCHIDCLDDWFEANLEDIINSVTVFYTND